MGLAYTDITEFYKYKMTDEIIRPDILCLGSSRIMKVNEDVTNKDYSFYNAGGAINNVYQYKLFLKKLHYIPKLLIISLDQWFFNPNYTNQERSFNPNAYEFPKRNMGNLFTSFIDDYIGKKINLKKIIDNKEQNIGLNAIINENGFQKDGSHYEGNLIVNPQSGEDFNFKDTFQRIADGNKRFEYFERADTNHIKVIDEFLGTCQEKNITVLAILPPFAPAVYRKMTACGNYPYLSQLYFLLKPIFESHENCILGDYTDMESFGVANKDFVDGFHGSELVYNMIIYDLIQKEDTLRKYFIHTAGIDSIIEKYKNMNIKYHNL